MGVIISRMLKFTFFRFVLVGLSGILVNQFFLLMFTKYLGLHYVLSSVIAIELAMANNFLWNSLWTFKNRIINKNSSVLVRFAKYNIVSWSLDIFNIVFIIIFTEIFKIYFLYSNLIAIAIVTLLKYLTNLKWVFAEEDKHVDISHPKISIIIPTYNEKADIGKLIENVRKELKKTGFKNEIIVVDDSSPDKTYEIVKKYQKKYHEIKLIVRKSKSGLSSAVIEGFKQSTGNIIGVMDADLSHPPQLIPKMIDKITKENADIAIGSRFVKGGKSLMSSIRNIGSISAIIFVWPLTFVNDSLSGFFFLRKSVIQGVNLNSGGFKILLEILVKGKYSKAVELPFTFHKRKHGKSKLTVNEVWEFLIDSMKLYVWKTLGT